LFIWDDELVSGMTPMMDDNAAMEASRVEGRNDEGCSKCTNIDEIMKRFDGRECVQWKKKFEDERKKESEMACVDVHSQLSCIWIVC
jgi:hypothetical protein